MRGPSGQGRLENRRVTTIVDDPTSILYRHAGNIHSTRGTTVHYYLEPWRKYATFRGRARRKELYTFAIVNWTIAFVLYFLSGPSEQSTAVPPLGWAAVACALVLVLPTIAAVVRRLHDGGRSGGWYFITFVPIIGSWWLFALTLLSGDVGPNEYGADPRDEPTQA